MGNTPPCTKLESAPESAPVFGSRDEKNESRIQQSYCELGVAAEMRTRFPQRLSLFRKGATVDGARGGRSVHERDPLRIPFARRSTHLVANGGTSQMRAHAVARLWRKSFSV